MIEKMQFVSITGPKADIDRVVDQYLSRYEIHLENALAQLQTLKTLTPYLQINPYKGLLAKALEYEKLLDSGNIQTNLTMTLDEAVALIESFDQQLTRINEQKKELERQKEKEVESLGRMVLDIENMKREFRKFYQLAESLTGMQNDLNQFRKVASDVRQMKTAMSQLQVSAKLNGNAVARILQQMQEQEPEPDSTEDSAES